MAEKLYYCDSCSKFVETHVEPREEIYDVRGEEIIITGDIRVCNIHNIGVYDEVLDSVNIKKAFNKFRNIHDYLDESEIKAVRINYGISRGKFAELLDTDSATVRRYETGSIPTFSHHEVLKNLKAAR